MEVGLLKRIKSNGRARSRYAKEEGDLFSFSLSLCCRVEYGRVSLLVDGVKTGISLDHLSSAAFEQKSHQTGAFEPTNTITPPQTSAFNTVINPPSHVPISPSLPLVSSLSSNGFCLDPCASWVSQSQVKTTLNKPT